MASTYTSAKTAHCLDALGVFLRVGADRVPLLHVAPRVAFTYSRGWAAKALRMLRSIAKDN